MRLVIQRVSEASVTVHGEVRGSIGQGLLVLVGVEDADSNDDAAWLAAKTVNLRIFDDAAQVPNLSVREVDGQLLVISQFTLFAATKKGNRPSYIRASKPTHAIPMYEAYVREVENLLGKPVATGVFGADMKVRLLNDGPITIIIDSHNRE